MELDEHGNESAGWPFMTDVDRYVSARIKQIPSDFRVSEIPLYVPAGAGDHVYVEIEKIGMTTNGAVAQLASALGVNPSHVGIAGQKDARALTRQWISIEHQDPDRIRQICIPGVRVLQVERHRNKLRMGHLKGNQFVVRLRDVELNKVVEVQQLLNELMQKGVPNYFGDQRFGVLRDNGQIGKALVREDFNGALEQLLGSPSSPLDSTYEARRLFVQGDYRASADAWPRGFGERAKLCRTYERLGIDPRRTLRSLSSQKLLFYVSAYQSQLFNRLLSERIHSGEMCILKCGDVAWKHENGACFLVTDACIDSHRAKSREISPTGPLFGARMKRASGETGDRETGILVDEEIRLEWFSRKGPGFCAGGRRPFRFFPENGGVDIGEDENGPYIEVGFSLPSGCYATVLLREICKQGLCLS